MLWWWNPNLELHLQTVRHVIIFNCIELIFDLRLIKKSIYSFSMKEMISIFVSFYFIEYSLCFSEGYLVEIHIWRFPLLLFLLLLLLLLLLSSSSGSSSSFLDTRGGWFRSLLYHTFPAKLLCLKLCLISVSWNHCWLFSLQVFFNSPFPSS